MGILNKLTLLNLKANKKRTLITILGVALSSMLLFLVATAGSVYREFSYKIVTDEYGTQDVIYDNVNMDQREIITNNEHVKSYFYITEVGKSPNNFDDITIYSISDGFNMNFNLNGSLPTNNQEIVISVDLAKRKNTNIGDTLILEVNGKNKEYTVTGIFPTNYAKGFKYYLNAYTKGEESQIGSFYVNFDGYDHISDKISDISYQLYGLSSAGPFTINTSLIGLYTMYGDGALTQAIIILFLMLTMLIIGFIVLFVIYNSFMISVNERKKSFAIYKSVGATSKQVLRSVLFEGFIISIVGIPLGFLLNIVVGYGVIEVLNQMLNHVLTFDLSLSFYFPFILLALFYIFACVFLACFMPAKRASEATIIDTIHQNTEFNKKGSIFKENKLVKKIFGMEGVISRKNIVRNSRKYNITVFSIILGCILFLSISTFVHFFSFISNIARSEYENMPVSVDVNREDAFHFSEQLQKEDYIENTIRISSYNSTMKARFRDEDIAIPYTSKDIYAVFTIIEDKYFDQIIQENNINSNIIVYNLFHTFQLPEQENRAFINLDINVDLLTYDLENKADVFYETVKATTFTEMPTDLAEKFPALFATTYMPRIYVRESASYLLGDILSETVNFTIQTKEYDKINQFVLDYQEKNILAIENYNNDGLYMINTLKTIYAFDFVAYLALAIIIIITITSIVNTVNTNMGLRRSEFAVLRSLGLSKKQFHKMIFFESLMLSFKALLFGLLLYTVILAFMFKAILINEDTIAYITQLIPYVYILICIASVFLIVYITMYFSTRKFYKDNIIDAIREEIME